jgi:hypothetical protein
LGSKDKKRDDKIDCTKGKNRMRSENCCLQKGDEKEENKCNILSKLIE